MWTAAGLVTTLRSVGIAWRAVFWILLWSAAMLVAATGILFFFLSLNARILSLYLISAIAVLALVAASLSGTSELAARLLEPWATRALYVLRKTEAEAFISTPAEDRARPFFLYLRPLKSAGKLPVLEIPRAYLGAQGSTMEHLLRWSVADRGELYAIGADPGPGSAVVLYATDDSWFTLFAELALAAEAVFVLPGASQGCLAELQYMARSGLLDKCVLVMPPGEVARSFWRGGFSWKLGVRDWTDQWVVAQLELRELGISLPPYDPGGALIGLMPKRQGGELCPLAGGDPQLMLNAVADIIGPRPSLRNPVPWAVVLDKLAARLVFRKPNPFM